MREHLLLLSRVLGEFKERFANIPDEVGILKAWVKRVEGIARKGEWHEAYEEIEEEDLEEIVGELDEELEEIGEEELAEAFRANLSSLQQAISGKNRGEVKRLAEKTDGDLNGFQNLFAEKRKEARAIDFMKDQAEEAEEAVEEYVWERAVHELNEVDEFIEELKEEEGITASQIVRVKNRVDEAKEAAEAKNEVLTKKKIAELKEILGGLE